MKTFCCLGVLALFLSACAWADPVIMVMTTLDNGGLPPLGSDIVGAFSDNGLGGPWVADGNCGSLSTMPVYNASSPSNPIEVPIDQGASTFCGYLGSNAAEPVSTLVVFYSGLEANDTNPANWDAVLEVFLQTGILLEDPSDIQSLANSGDLTLNFAFGVSNTVVYIPDPPGPLEYDSPYTNTDFLLNNDSVINTPEPATLLLVGPGLAALGFRRRRRAALAR